MLARYINIIAMFNKEKIDENNFAPLLHIQAKF